MLIIGHVSFWLYLILYGQFILCRLMYQINRGKNRVNGKREMCLNNFYGHLTSCYLNRAERLLHRQELWRNSHHMGPIIRQENVIFLLPPFSECVTMFITWQLISELVLAGSILKLLILQFLRVLQQEQDHRQTMLLLYFPLNADTYPKIPPGS